MEIALNYTKWAANKRHIDGDTTGRCANESGEGRRKITKSSFSSLPRVASTVSPSRHDDSDPLIWIALDNTSSSHRSILWKLIDRQAR